MIGNDQLDSHIVHYFLELIEGFRFDMKPNNIALGIENLGFIIPKSCDAERPFHLGMLPSDRPRADAVASLAHPLGHEN